MSFSVIYGKQSVRHNLTDICKEISWSSARDEICQSISLQLKDAPAMQEAGMIMVFGQRMPSVPLLNQLNQIFHGPIIEPVTDDFTHETAVSGYELGWYLSKNKATRPYLKGEAGTELQNFVRSSGINFSCPKLGFSIDNRYNTGPISEIVLDVLKRARDHTGYYYYVDHRRDKLTVVREGTNTIVPVFAKEQMTASTRSRSIEGTYTVVTVQKWKDDKLVQSITKENAGAIKNLGRMEEIIEAEENENPTTIATQMLQLLSNPKLKRNITVRHSNHALCFLRAGWLVMTQEATYKQKWIVTKSDTSYRNGEYIVSMELEWRE